MSVYVDCSRNNYGRYKMCHMVADSREELLAMVDTIGVERKWLQHGGTDREHFDICQSKRSRALAAGAIEITNRQLAVLLRKRRELLQKLPSEGQESSEEISNVQESSQSITRKHGIGIRPVCHDSYPAFR